MLKRDYDHLKSAKPASMRLHCCRLQWDLGCCTNTLDRAPVLIDCNCLAMRGWAAMARRVSADVCGSWWNWRCRAATPEHRPLCVYTTTRDKDAVLRVTADGLGGDDQVLQGALANGNAGSEAALGELDGCR